jgi:hypothetical protein
MNKFVFYNNQEEYTLALDYLINVLNLDEGDIPKKASHVHGYFRWFGDSALIFYGSYGNFMDEYGDTPRENIFTLKIRTVVDLESLEPFPELIEIHGVEWVLSDVVKAIQQADLTPWSEPKGYADGLPC